MSSKKCNCCKTFNEVNDVCTYCGYEIPFDLAEGEEENPVIKKDAEKWRNNIVGKISDISFEIHIGVPLSDKDEVPELNTVKTKLADGSDCYGKIVWAAENIWQDQEVDIEKMIPISYRFDGQEYTAEVQIKTRRTNDWWKFGVMLEDNLHLRFFLGTRDNYSQSELVPLKLV